MKRGRASVTLPTPPVDSNRVRHEYRLIELEGEGCVERRTSCFVMMVSALTVGI